MEFCCHAAGGGDCRFALVPLETGEVHVPGCGGVVARYTSELVQSVIGVSHHLRQIVKVLFLQRYLRCAVIYPICTHKHANN